MKNCKSLDCFCACSARAERRELTVAEMEPMKEEKTPMANKMIQMEKNLSKPLTGAMLLVAGVNCVKDQCKPRTAMQLKFRDISEITGYGYLVKIQQVWFLRFYLFGAILT